MAHDQEKDSEDIEKVYEKEFSYYKLWIMAACFSIVASGLFFYTFPEIPQGLATFPPGAFLIGLVLWLLSILVKLIFKPVPLLRYTGILLVMIGICTFLIVALLTLTPAGELFGLNIFAA